MRLNSGSRRFIDEVRTPHWAAVPDDRRDARALALGGHRWVRLGGCVGPLLRLSFAGRRGALLRSADFDGGDGGGDAQRARRRAGIGDELPAPGGACECALYDRPAERRTAGDRPRGGLARGGVQGVRHPLPADRPAHGHPRGGGAGGTDADHSGTLGLRRQVLPAYERSL